MHSPEQPLVPAHDQRPAPQSSGTTAGDPHLSEDELRAILAVAMRAGQLLLVHGADTHRVEETVQRMGRALGAGGMDVYVTPTGIIATAISGPEYETRISRAIMSGVDLGRLAAVNLLSRRLTAGPLAYQEVAAELEEIAHQERFYGPWTTVATVALSCACFALLFGGGWREGTAVLFGAGLAMRVRQVLVHRGAGFLLHVPLATFIAVVTAVGLGTLLGAQDYDVVVPASVLLLVPGVPLITALSDLLESDFISGVIRVAQAILIATLIAVGMAMALALMRTVGWEG